LREEWVSGANQLSALLAWVASHLSDRVAPRLRWRLGIVVASVKEYGTVVVATATDTAGHREGTKK